MNTLDDIKPIMAKNDITLFGIMNYTEIKPQMFLPCRAQSRLPQNAKSVIVCAFPYYKKLDGIERNICRYAIFPDYHTVIGDILKNVANELFSAFGGKFECFCDNSPLPEIFCAIKSGIGYKGKNNLLITDEYGSYVLIGCIVTDCEFKATAQNEKSCLSCGRCITACKTNALSENGFDFSKCLSFITQKKGELSQEEESAVQNGALVWGCDRCQEACPHNKGIKETQIKQFTQSIEPVLTFDNLDDLIKTRPYGYRGKKLLERNLRLILSI